MNEYIRPRDQLLEFIAVLRVLELQSNGKLVAVDRLESRADSVEHGR